MTSNFLVYQNESLRQALMIIDQNQHGLVFVRNSEGAVIGVATDGDIRRSLLDGANLDDAIAKCVNKKFIWANLKTPREALLKLLDQKIKAIPVLNEKLELVEIVSFKHLPPDAEGSIFSRARAPVRISFGGGGSDLTHFFLQNSGAVINATLSLYTHVTIRKRLDSRVLISSRDLDEEISCDCLSDFLNMKDRLGLIQAILRLVHPDFGFELYIYSDYPIHSGLGGSSAVAVAILGCFNEFRRDKWDAYELAELAYQAERLYLGVAGGWQDQYAAAFGGFNFMEFKAEQNIIQPLRLPNNRQLELEECLLLCDSGEEHNSGDIHADQALTMSRLDIREKVKRNVELTYKMRNELLRGHFDKFGESLDEAWNLKRQFSSKISSDRIDKIYSGALQNGALGGKLLGAGGGGFFLFYVPPFEKFNLISYMESINLKIWPLHFELEGMQSWSLRDHS